MHHNGGGEQRLHGRVKLGFQGGVQIRKAERAEGRKDKGSEQAKDRGRKVSCPLPVPEITRPVGTVAPPTLMNSLLNGGQHGKPESTGMSKIASCSF